MARIVNERADELFLLQSMPMDDADSWKRAFEDFINGKTKYFDFANLLNTSELRPHLFQELPLTYCNTSQIEVFHRFCLAELSDPTDGSEPLTELDLTSATAIGPYAFWNSKNLAIVKNTDKVETIGSETTDYHCVDMKDGSSGHVFSNTAIENLNFPLVYEVPEHTFCNMPSLKTIALSTNRECTIGANAFLDCNQLENVYANIKTVEDSAFKNCSSLKSFTQEKCDFVGYESFMGCNNLKIVYIGGKDSKIEHYAFYNTGLTEILISDSKSIGSYSFKDCNDLEEVTIRGNDINDYQLPYGVFAGDTNLKILSLEFSSYVNKEEDSLPHRIDLPEDFVIYVDPDLIDRYTSDPQWEEYWDCFAAFELTILTTEGEEHIPIATDNSGRKIGIRKGEKG